MIKTEHKLYLYSLTELPSYSNPFYNHTIQFIRRTECPECMNTKIDYDGIRDELVCRKCGLVLESSAPYVGHIKIHYPFSYKFLVKIKEEMNK
jgi:ribosomal protein S27E